MPFLAVADSYPVFQLSQCDECANLNFSRGAYTIPWRLEEYPNPVMPNQLLQGRKLVLGRNFSALPFGPTGACLRAKLRP